MQAAQKKLARGHFFSTAGSGKYDVRRKRKKATQSNEQGLSAHAGSGGGESGQGEAPPDARTAA